MAKSQRRTSKSTMTEQRETNVPEDMSPRTSYNSNSYNGYQQNYAPYSFGSMLNFLGNNAGLLFLGLAVFLGGFLAGSTWRENDMLRKGIGSGTAQAGTLNNANPPTQAEPTPQPLSDADWKTIQEGAPAVEGDKNAKVTIVEFTDYQCPFCGQFYTQTYKSLIDKYVKTGKAKFVIRDYPLTFHPNAKPGALAARCAGDQGKYLEMHDELFGKQAEWSNLAAADAVAKFGQYADGIGISGSKLVDCVNSGKFTKVVDDDTALGTKIGVSGTPSFVINKEMLVGAQPMSAFEAAIDKNLK
jgi:protein-disulfide isomerase